MKIDKWIIVIGLIIAVGGYIWGFIQHQRNVTLEQTVLDEDIADIGIIDNELSQIRNSKEITVNDLKESQKRLFKIITEIEARSSDSITVEDALKIIEGM